MADLISRSALLEKLNLLARYEDEWRQTCILGVCKTIEYAPAVDAVEVVRCKDCKHWLKDVVGCTDAIGRCEWANYMVGAVGYCVYGERKENETD